MSSRTGLVWLLAAGAVVSCAEASGRPRAGSDAQPEGDGSLPKLSDAFTPDSGGNQCKVPSGDDNAAICTASAPPNAFTPKLKWSYTAPPKQGPGYEGIQVIPLVANLTDDNHDGAIDLCDTPDVIVVTSDEIGASGTGGQMRMLAGDTGKEELTFSGVVDYSVTPALGDLDGDGVPEIVTHDDLGRLVIYAADGAIKHVSSAPAPYKSDLYSFCTALGIYDLDGDGAPEIISAFAVYDNQAQLKFAVDESAYAGQYWCPANIAADLDGDGKLEVIFGNAAYHADGSLYWSIQGPPGQPQVANLDADPDPELFVARADGIVILEHDGTLKLGPSRPTDEPISPNCWSKPGAVHDFDGDGIADLSASTCTLYGVYHLGAQLSLQWSASIEDNSGLSSTTAFDFLGKGIAQAVYTDEQSLFVFDGNTGSLIFSEPRTSRTLIEFPVVADADNDGSADILVVSNGASGFGPALQVFEDASQRWIPTRRIWNQHAYSVVNVREDGTIPAHMAKSWANLNTFRTNAQVQGNAACKPAPPN